MFGTENSRIDERSGMTLRKLALDQAQNPLDTDSKDSCATDLLFFVADPRTLSFTEKTSCRASIDCFLMTELKGRKFVVMGEIITGSDDRGASGGWISKCTLSFPLPTPTQY